MSVYVAICNTANSWNNIQRSQNTTTTFQVREKMSPVLVSNGRREKRPEIRELPWNTGDLAALVSTGAADCPERLTHSLTHCGVSHGLVRREFVRPERRCSAISGARQCYQSHRVHVMPAVLAYLRPVKQRAAFKIAWLVHQSSSGLIAGYQNADVQLVYTVDTGTLLLQQRFFRLLVSLSGTICYQIPRQVVIYGEADNIPVFSLNEIAALVTGHNPPPGQNPLGHNPPTAIEYFTHDVISNQL